MTIAFNSSQTFYVNSSDSMTERQLMVEEINNQVSGQ